MDFGHLIDWEEKSLEEKSDVWTVEGYAAIFNTRDLGGDIIRPGAFSRSLKELGTPPLILEHDMKGLPVGAITEIEEDRRGLRYVAELPKEDPVSARVAAQIKARKNGVRGLKGTSFGYIAVKKTFEKIEGKSVRVLHDVDCFEISFVKMPLHPQAGPTSIKSDDRIGIVEWKDFTDREREASLKARGMSDDLAKRIVRLEREAQVKSDRREAGGWQQVLPDFAGLIRAAAATR